MLANEGMIEASAAERGVRGASVRRQLVMNQGQFGLSQAMRSRALATAGFDAKEVMADTNRQLKSTLNRSFSKVAVAPVQDIAPPPPVMQNVGMTLMLGMGQALAAGLEANIGNNTMDAGQTPTFVSKSGSGMAGNSPYLYTTDPTFGHQIRTFQSY